MKKLNSQSSPLYVNEVVPRNGQGGWVALTICPGKKTVGTGIVWERDLDADLLRLRELEVTTLVPLIEDEEMLRLQVGSLVEKAEAAGLAVRRFPFHDGGVPPDLEATVEFIDEVCRRYRRGERLVIHCNGGLGRAGTIAACLRLRLGLDADADAAIARVRQLRDPRAIETREQERFIQRFDVCIRGRAP